MTPNSLQREQAYATASQNQRLLYSAPESGIRLYKIARTHQITSEEQYQRFAVVVGDFVLRFYKQSELPTVLGTALGLTAGASFKLAADVIDFLAPLESEPESVPVVISAPTAPVAVASTVVTPPAPEHVRPILQSVAAELEQVPVAQPRSSAQLTSTSAPVTEPPLREALTPPAPPLPTTNVEPVRTMGEDAQRIHGYGAYREQYPHLYSNDEQNKAAIRSVAQDALLRRPAVVDTPNFTNPE